MQQSYNIDMDKASVWMLISAGADTKENIPYVQEVGDFIAHNKYFTMREGLPSYLIKYTLSGEGSLRYDNKDYSLPAGCFFWIDCRNPQYYRTSERTGEWRIVWIHFWGPSCSYYYRQFLSANGGSPVGEMFTGNNIVSNIYSLIELYQNKRGEVDTDLQAAAILTSLMAECIHATSQKTETPSARYVRLAQDFIIAHYREKITLDTLAAHLSLNKFYFQKLFKEHTGKTPNAYLSHIRLNHAKEMLRVTEMPIAAIAMDSGIENTSYFIRLFRSFEGMTPAVYRNHWQIK